MRRGTSNRNEFTFNIGFVVSIFDTLVFVARRGGCWAYRSSIEREKRAENRLVHHEFMPSSYAPFFLFDLMRAGVIYRNSGIVLRQFKAPNEHKFDCLFALLMQFLMRTRYISTSLSKNSLLGVTFRQAKIKINYANKNKLLISKRTKVCANFYRVIRIIDFRRWKLLHHVEMWSKWFLLSVFFDVNP